MIGKDKTSGQVTPTVTTLIFAPQTTEAAEAVCSALLVIVGRVFYLRGSSAVDVPSESGCKLNAKRQSGKKPRKFFAQRPEVGAVQGLYTKQPTRLPRGLIRFPSRCRTVIQATGLPKPRQKGRSRPKAGPPRLPCCILHNFHKKFGFFTPAANDSTTSTNTTKQRKHVNRRFSNFHKHNENGDKLLQR